MNRGTICSVGALVDLLHAANQMLDDDLVGFARVDGEVGVLECVHVEQHGVAAAVGQEDARHGRRCRGREPAVDQEAAGAALLQAGAGAQRAELARGGARPVAGTPARHQGAGRRLAARGIGLDECHAVLARVADRGEQPVVRGGPGLHADAAVVHDVERGEARLQRTEDHALLDEAVVRAAVARGEIAVSEGAVLALEATRESRDRAFETRRADHAVGHQRCRGADAVRPGQRRVAHGLRRARRPADPRVVAAEREAEIELVEIEGDQIVERRGLDRVERVRALAMAREDRARDRLRPDDAEMDAGDARYRIPAAEDELPSRSPPRPRCRGARARRCGRPRHRRGAPAAARGRRPAVAGRPRRGPLRARRRGTGGHARSRRSPRRPRPDRAGIR